MKILLLCAALLAPLPACAAPSAPVEPNEMSIVYPQNSGVLNVRDEKFGAKGDGKTDDTVAIQKALTAGLGAHRVVYLPDGTYLVSDTLKWWNPANAGNNTKGWGPFLQLQGQSRSKTIIKLKDGVQGFGDEEAPKAVIVTGSSGGHGNKQYTGGEGNEAFENHLRNFTVETGNNAGAVGIDWQASNVGAMRHVSIRGNGYAGISLTRRDNGPALIKDVSIDGFQFGIRTAQEIAHFTLEDITLSGQGEAGIWVRDSIVAARKIISRNSVPAMQVGGVALVALFDSDFSGGDGGGAAIATQGTEPRLYIRNLKTTGYAGSIRLRGEVQKPLLTEWSSDKPVGNAAEKLSLGLPVRETPEWYDANPANWAVLPPPSGQDDTKIIQAALNSGKATVFFPYGRFFISDTLWVPASVKRIQGLGSQLNTKGRLPDDKPMLRFEGAKAGDLTIFDRFECGAADGFMVEHVDARTVVLTDIIVFGASGYRNKVGAGPLFVEDVACGGWRFAPGTQAWTRQWNIEGAGPNVINDGATIWTLGWKTEGGSLIVENKNGGRSEMWGGFAYTFGVPADRPALINTDASLALQVAGTTYLGPTGYYDLLVKDTQKGQTTELRRANVVGRGNAATVPLYVSISGTQPPVAAAPIANINSQGNDMNRKQLATTTAGSRKAAPGP